MLKLTEFHIFFCPFGFCSPIMSVNTFVGLCVYDMCLREREEHEISIFGKIVSYLKAG